MGTWFQKTTIIVECLNPLAVFWVHTYYSIPIFEKVVIDTFAGKNLSRQNIILSTYVIKKLYYANDKYLLGH